GANVAILAQRVREILSKRVVLWRRAAIIESDDAFALAQHQVSRPAPEPGSPCPPASRRTPGAGCQRATADAALRAARLWQDNAARRTGRSRRHALCLAATRCGRRRSARLSEQPGRVCPAYGQHGVITTIRA